MKFEFQVVFKIIFGPNHICCQMICLLNIFEFRSICIYFSSWGGRYPEIDFAVSEALECLLELLVRHLLGYVADE